jgi:hypothetical protein
MGSHLFRPSLQADRDLGLWATGVQVGLSPTRTRRSLTLQELGKPSRYGIAGNYYRAIPQLAGNARLADVDGHASTKLAPRRNLSRIVKPFLATTAHRMRNSVRLEYPQADWRSGRLPGSPRFCVIRGAYGRPSAYQTTKSVIGGGAPSCLILAAF